MTSPLSFIDTVCSHLEGLEESGCQHVPLSAPFIEAPVSPPTPAPRPRQQPASAPPQEPPASKAVLPDPPAPKAVADTLTRRFIWAVLNRVPECGDPHPPDNTRVVLVTEAGELEGANQKLLADILHAIGYELPSRHEDFTTPREIADKGARILVMGNPALQAVSPAGMDLKIVRGMWQQTPQGKMLSTYAPSSLIENIQGKKATWGDLQKLLKELELDIPEWTRKRLG
ncbi:MAG: hypothetical protein WD708_04455 [Kiritimatiellia bacterium]